MTAELVVRIAFEDIVIGITGDKCSVRFWDFLAARV